MALILPTGLLFCTAVNPASGHSPATAFKSKDFIVYQLLKKYGFTATLFVYTNFVGISKMAITWAQLKELKADGFSIGSHTMYLSDLTMPGNGEDRAGWMSRKIRNYPVPKRPLMKNWGNIPICWLIRSASMISGPSNLPAMPAIKLQCP